MTLASVLPYRTDAPALAAWLEARARGRTAEQLRVAMESTKGAEGTAAAAAALGFVEGDQARLTALGERFALAEEGERRALLEGSMHAYAPFAAVFEALKTRGGVQETEVRWIEALWATRGFGSSASNRREGAAAFGRLIDYVGLGEYVPGRRGRPTRIRWSRMEDGLRTPAGASTAAGGARLGVTAPQGAPDLFTLSAPPPDEAEVVPPRDPEPSPHPPPPQPPPTGDPAGEGEPPGRRHDPAGAHRRPEVATNRITVPLAGEAVARVEVPLRLPRAEKRRLLDLLELLITDE